MIGRFIDFKQSHVRTASDVDQHGLRAVHGGFIQQRVVDRRFGRIGSTVVTRCFTSAHHGFAHFRHHRPNISKIKVDVAWLDHQISDAANAFMQDIICHGESISKSGALIGQTEQILVRDNNQRIDISLQFFDP